MAAGGTTMRRRRAAGAPAPASIPYSSRPSSSASDTTSVDQKHSLSVIDGLIDWLVGRLVDHSDHLIPYIEAYKYSLCITNTAFKINQFKGPLSIKLT